MYQDLLDVNNKIKAEADVLLHDRGLLSLLAAYGMPVVHGSYTMNLMTWRDLDIRVVTDAITKEQAFGLGKELCKLLDPAAMNFKDWSQRHGAFSVCGYYWGVLLGEDESKADWKIDIAIISPAEQEINEKFAQSIRNRLTDETREVILEIKSVCCKDPQYRKTYHSVDVYQAVLDHGVKNLESFRKYLAQKHQSVI